MTNFTVGMEGAKRHSDPFSHLTLDQRRDLVYDALIEAGAGTIRESGTKFIHSCVFPFGNHSHGDRNPSGFVNYAMMAGGCSVCGTGGWLWWIATVKGLESTAAARDWVAQHAGDDRVDDLQDLLSFLDQLYDPPPQFRQPPPVYDDSVLKPWMLIHPYMTEYRGVPMETMVRLKVGYGTFRVKVGEDRWVSSDRIVIPHFFDGKLYGWQTRRLGNDGTPKYMSTPEMPKDTTLYNYAPDGDRIVVVESPLTVLRHSHHTPISATFGASVTDRQIELIARSKGKVILWFDNDTAGWIATEAVGDKLMGSNVVWAVDNPFEGDPGDLDEERFQWTLANRVVPYALWSRPDGDSLIGKDDDHGYQEVRHGTGTR